MFRKSWKVQLFYGYAEWGCEFTIRGKSVSAKFRELSGILTRNDVSLRLNKMYVTSVRSAMVHGSETLRGGGNKYKQDNLSRHRSRGKPTMT